MAAPTDPTVPLPTTDVDDDDDDDVTSIAPAPLPPAPTTTTNLPTTSAPSTLSSATGVPTPTSPDASASASASSTPAPASGDGGLSVGASVGIGLGAALAIILLLLGAWLFVRKRRAGLHRMSKGSVASDTGLDPETAGKVMGPEIYAHRALGPAEMEAERRPSELASPVVPVEADGDRHFAAELPGSYVPPQGIRKESKGSRERLFLDSPIDEEEGRFEKDLRPVDEKKPPL